MTTKTVEVHEAQQHLVELVAQVAAGTETIITHRQTPRACLVPVAAAASRRVPGLHAGSMTTSSDFDAPLPDDFWIGTSRNCCLIRTRLSGGTAIPTDCPPRRWRYVVTLGMN